MDMELSLRSRKPRLSEEMVGKILAMLPFPYIFKARTLSKSWLARFSSVASQDDEVNKQSAVWFHLEVGKCSYKWETYFPVCFGNLHSIAFQVGVSRTISCELPTALDVAAPEPLCSLSRSSLPSLSFLPEKLLTCSNLEMEGPLLYWCRGSKKTSLYVANILTRRWKKLPRRRHGLGCEFYRLKLVIQKPAQTYKVVVFCGNDDDLRVLIYDSKSQVWTSNAYVLSESLKFLSPIVHLDGLLYMVAYHTHANLLAFNMEEKTLESVRIFSTDKLMMTNVDLVVCDGRLLIIVTNGFYKGGLQVLKVDIVTEQLLEVSRGPPAAVYNPSFEMRRRRRPVCYGNCIYFRIADQMLEYNVDEDKWRWLDFLVTSWDLEFPFMSYYEWSAFSFQPGLTPFVEV